MLTGSQQGIDLACKALLDPGDVGLGGAPTYLTALQVIGMYQGRAVAVPGDEHGMSPDALGSSHPGAPAQDDLPRAHVSQSFGRDVEP